MDLNFPQPDRDTRRFARASIHRNWRNLWGAFNLNDPRWGRGDDADREDKNAGDEGVNRPDDEGSRPNRDQRPSRGQVPNQGPPDLDELWRDFNRKLGGLFGGKGVAQVDVAAVPKVAVEACPASTRVQRPQGSVLV